MPREIISVHVGQAGVQVGNACWELFCMEAGIKGDGTMEGKPERNQTAFFNEMEGGKYRPRAIFVDTDPECTANLKTSTYGGLFGDDQLIQGKEDASSCFARGKFSIGKPLNDLAQERIRKLVEECGNLQGFMMYHAIGGGTGSGLGTLMMNSLADDDTLGKKSRVAFTVFPSEKASAACVEPYNCVFSAPALIQSADSVVMLDNQALYGLCREKLKVKDLSLKNLNQVIAQVVSSLTLSMRFSGQNGLDLRQFHTNLVPYPKLHFLLSSLAPLAAPDTDFFQGLNEMQITVDAFHPKSMMVKCDPTKGHYMSCAMMYRGDINPSAVSKSIETIKQRRRFVDWCPTGFKVGINQKKMVNLPNDNMHKADKSAVMIGNNTRITEVYSRIHEKFDLMYNRRAFVHWFIQEGMEEGEIPDAREQIDAMKEDYEEVLKMVEASDAGSEAGEH